MSEIEAPYTKPLPEITEENREFWEGTRRGELRMQKCGACGHIRYPVAPVCPKCLSADTVWTPLSGRGTVFSYVVFHQVYNAGFREEVPYNVALIQLEEGPRLFSNVVGTANAEVRVGDAVEIVYDPVTPTVTLPRFRPVKDL